MNNKSWFYRLLLSYLPVFFAISLSLLFITYLTLGELSRKAAFRANEIVSHDIAQTIDRSLYAIDQAMTDLALNDDRLKAFLSPALPAERQYIDYMAVESLKKLMVANPLIDSVYVYRMDDNVVLTPTSMVAIEQFGDKRFIGKQFNSFAAYRWTGARAYSERSGGGTGASVVSLVKLARLLDRSLLVVNVRVDKLNELVANMARTNLNFVELADSAGTLIASGARTGVGAQSGGAAGRTKVWTEIRSAYTQWTVRSGSYNHDIWETVSSLYYISIGLGSAVVVLGVLWLLYVTRRNYKPLQTIAGRVSEYIESRLEHLRLKPNSDELKYLGNAFEELLEHSSSLSEANEQNARYRIRLAFTELLKPIPKDEKGAWLAEIEDFGVDIGGIAGFSVAVIEIDHYADFCARFGERDQRLFKHVIARVNLELCEKEGLRVWAEWQRPSRLYAVYVRTGEAAAGLDEANVCEKLRDWLERNTKLTVTIGVGDTEHDPLRLSDGCMLAERLLEYKSALGANRVITRSDLIDKPQGELFRQFHQIRTICQLFRSGDSEWERAFHEFFDQLAVQLFARDELTMVVQLFWTNLHKELSELSGELRGIGDAESSRLQAILQREDTAADIRDELRALLVDMFGRMNELRQLRAVNPLIQQIKDYIGAHYANPDLSLALIGTEFNLSVSYVSRLLKESFGVKFVDYVAQIRMDKAVELLKGPEPVTVQDIAMTVGYANTLTFIRAFKKATGTTPGQYRKDTT